MKFSKFLFLNIIIKVIITTITIIVEIIQYKGINCGIISSLIWQININLTTLYHN